MRYCLARYKADQKSEAYRIYVTDALRVMTENTATFEGSSYIKKRYIDIIDPKPEDNRTGAEIVADVAQKAGLKIIKTSHETEVGT